MDVFDDLDNFVTLPLSEFMFVVRNLWLDESSKYNFSGAQDKIEILLNFLDLGREATIIDFAKHKLNTKRLEELPFNHKSRTTNINSLNGRVTKLSSSLNISILTN